MLHELQADVMAALFDARCARALAHVQGGRLSLTSRISLTFTSSDDRHPAECA